jgi:hypothetical protein
MRYKKNLTSLGFNKIVGMHSSWEACGGGFGPALVLGRRGFWAAKRCIGFAKKAYIL